MKIILRFNCTNGKNDMNLFYSCKHTFFISLIDFLLFLCEDDFFQCAKMYENMSWMSYPIKLYTNRWSRVWWHEHRNRHYSWSCHFPLLHRPPLRLGSEEEAPQATSSSVRTKFCSYLNDMPFKIWLTWFCKFLKRLRRPPIHVCDNAGARFAAMDSVWL